VGKAEVILLGTIGSLVAVLLIWLLRRGTRQASRWLNWLTLKRQIRVVNGDYFIELETLLWAVAAVPIGISLVTNGANVFAHLSPGTAGRFGDTVAPMIDSIPLFWVHLLLFLASIAMGVTALRIFVDRIVGKYLNTSLKVLEAVATKAEFRELMKLKALVIDERSLTEFSRKYADLANRHEVRKALALWWSRDES